MSAIPLGLEAGWDKFEGDQRYRPKVWEELKNLKAPAIRHLKAKRERH